MKKRKIGYSVGLSRFWAMAASLFCFAAGAIAQSSLPAPGGGNSVPAPGSGGMYNPAPGGGPGPGGMCGPGPGGWGSPWGGGWNGPNGAFLNGPNWQNQGEITVMACGYDVYGVWRTIPLRVSYQYNGVQYDVTVISAWNPWSDMWNTNIDTPAYNTSYMIQGNTYDFYVPLASGTYYFNL